MLSDCCLSVCLVSLSVCLSCPVCLSVMLVYCGQTVGWIKMKLGMQVDLGPGHIVLDGDPAPLSEIGQSPQFLAYICCGQMAGWIKMPLGREVGLSPSDIVLDGDPASPSQKGHSPQFSAHICCGQMAGWIKTPLGREVSLSPSDIVLDGDPAPPPKRGQSPPIFGPRLLWSNGWMDEDATGYGSRPHPRPHCLRRGPSSPRRKGHSSPLYCGHCRPSQLLLSSCQFRLTDMYHRLALGNRAHYIATSAFSTRIAYTCAASLPPTATNCDPVDLLETTIVSSAQCYSG